MYTKQTDAPTVLLDRKAIYPRKAVFLLEAFPESALIPRKNGLCLHFGLSAA
jgi:hypothetical protein